MKFFDTDWGGVLRWLAVWERMSPAVRRHCLLVAPAPTQAVPAEGYGSELVALLEAGLVEKTPTGGVKPSAASVRFRARLVQLARQPLFDQMPNHLRLGVRDPDDFDHLPWLESIWRQTPLDDCVAPRSDRNCSRSSRTRACSWRRADIPFLPLPPACFNPT